MLLGQDENDGPNEYARREHGSRKHKLSRLGVFSREELEEEKREETEGDEESMSSPIATKEYKTRETGDDSDEEMKSGRGSTDAGDWFRRKRRDLISSIEVVKCSVEEPEAERDELLQQQTIGKGMGKAGMLKKLKQVEGRTDHEPEGDYRQQKGVILIKDRSEPFKEGESSLATTKRDSPGWVLIPKRKCVGSEPVQR